ncbi:hypothetical protein [Burkholderia ubonensis]|uniref:hypothetical protein n=1 Tax=Burkholderia ubonensis TaxID=101571 RepID=UPI0012F918DC|nr:hypothetical protein [Burkholderia ubonensis]
MSALVVRCLAGLAVGEQSGFVAEQDRFSYGIDADVVRLGRPDPSSEIVQMQAVGRDRARFVLQGSFGQPHRHHVPESIGSPWTAFLCCRRSFRPRVDGRLQDRRFVEGDSRRQWGRWHRWREQQQVERTSSSVSRTARKAKSPDFVMKSGLSVMLGCGGRI